MFRGAPHSMLLQDSSYLVKITCARLLLMLENSLMNFTPYIRDTEDFQSHFEFLRIGLCNPSCPGKPWAWPVPSRILENS